MKRTSRILALVMAFAMVLSLAGMASAATNVSSAELVISAEGVDLSGKVAVSTEEGALSVGTTMAVNGETTADLTAYLTKDALVLASALLDNPYGVEFGKLAENLPNSVFAPNSGSQLAMSQEAYDQLLNLISGNADTQETTVELPEMPTLPEEVDVPGLTDAIVALVPAFSQGIEAASKNMTMESSTGKLTINGTEVNVQTVKVQYGTASVIALYDAVLSAAKDDEAAQNAIATLIDLVNATGEDLGVTGAEFVQALVEHNQEMRDSMAEALGQYDIQCEVTVSANEEGTALVEAGVKLSMDGEPVEMKLQLGEGYHYIRLELNAGEETAALVFDITEDTDDALQFRLSVQSGADEDAIAYTQDKKAQTFEVSLVETLSGDTTTTSFSGHYVNEEDLFSLVVDKVDGEDIGGTVTLNLRKNDTMTAPSFTELTKLTEEELTNAVQELAGSVQAIGALFSGDAA